MRSLGTYPRTRITPETTATLALFFLPNEVTFEPALRPNMTLRRARIAASLLILMLVVSASACVVGICTPSVRLCTGLGGKSHCFRPQPHSPRFIVSGCGHALKSSSAKCDLRGLVQFQLLGLSRFESSVPLGSAVGNIALPLDSRIAIRSVGPPETDRGPPRS
jgi:hypothetical protein